MLKEVIGGGTCCTVMISHVSCQPDHYEESLGTIQLAHKLHRTKKRKSKSSLASTSGVSTTRHPLSTHFILRLELILETYIFKKFLGIKIQIIPWVHLQRNYFFRRWRFRSIFSEKAVMQKWTVRSTLPWGQKRNKTGTSQIGAPLKAQKEQSF